MTAHRPSTIVGYQAEAYAESERDARRIKETTGCDPMPRGAQLVEYVEREMRSAKTAEMIAGNVGYSVQRCAELLGRCRNAPLARLLLDRQAMDVTRSDDDATADEIIRLGSEGATWAEVASAVGRTPSGLLKWATAQGLEYRAGAWFPDLFAPEPMGTSRPKPTADELLWEIEDAHARDLQLEDVAAMFGVDIPTIRRWARRRHIAAEVERFYPRRVSGLPTAKATRRKCMRGHVMYQTPGQRARCRECRNANARQRAAA